MFDIALSPFQELFGWFLSNTENSLAVAVIGLTMAVRIPIIPLHIAFFKTQQKIQDAQDEIKKIQEKYKNDRQKLSQEIMAVYKEKGIKIKNIFLFFFVQIPVYILLFFTITAWEKIPLDGEISSVLFGIDLASKGSLLLILVVIITQTALLWLTQKNIPQNKGAKKYLMYILVPIIAIFSFFLGNLITWYIVVINCFSILQEVFILQFVRHSKSPQG